MTDNEHVHEHDRGLSHDLPTLINRRRALGLFGGAGIVALTACSGPNDSPSTSPTSSATGSTASASEEIPEETGGPFPADGSNGVNVLTESGVVRSDITRSFGSSNTVAAGIPLAIELTVLDVGNGGKPLEGAAVYIWHCDRDGQGGFNWWSQHLVITEVFDGSSTASSRSGDAPADEVSGNAVVAA